MHFRSLCFTKCKYSWKLECFIRGLNNIFVTFFFIVLQRLWGVSIELTPRDNDKDRRISNSLGLRAKLFTSVSTLELRLHCTRCLCFSLYILFASFTFPNISSSSFFHSLDNFLTYFLYNFPQCQSTRTPPRRPR